MPSISTSNSFGTVATDIIAQEALQRLIQNLGFIKNCNKNFFQTGLVFGQNINTHIITEMGANDFDTNYTNNGEDAVQTDVLVPLDQHKHVTFQLSDAQRDASQVDLFGRFADVAAYGLAKAIVDYLLGSSTLGADAATITNELDLEDGGLTMSSLIDLGSAMDAAGIPAQGRWLVAHPTVLADLEKDVTEVTNSSFSVNSSILEGGVNRIRGFDIYSYANDLLVTTDDSTGAVAGFGESLLLVAAPPTTPPNSAGSSLSYVSEPDTGLTIQKREWYDPDYGVFNFVLTTYLGTKLSAADRMWRVKN